MASTKETIVNYLTEQGRVTPKSLGEHLQITPQALFRHIKTLLQENKIIKIGRPPKVFYALPTESNSNSSTLRLDDELAKIIETNFFFLTPTGISKEGVSGLSYWCQKFKLNFEKTAKEYVKTWQKYNQYKHNGLIDGSQKMLTTFDTIYMDSLYYLDFYAIERFGKTKLGYYLLYAKQSQSLAMINLLIEECLPTIQKMVKRLSVDAIGFAPPTVKRQVQLMSVLKEKCHCNLPILSIEKIKTPIIVPQKTLSKLPDRIENAEETMIVTDKRRFNNILLIDDAVGSGSTLNAISKQIKKNKLCKKKLICLALTGSFKGFEVINEV